LERLAVPTVFTIDENDEGGFDVTARDLIAEGERRERIAHFHAMGWSEAEVERELHSMEGSRKLNETRAYGLAVCLEYVASYVDPGDVLIERGRVFVVSKCGEA
jgi:hypothetical protein